MPNKNKKQLTARECIAIAKKCRKRIAFGQGMMYGVKQDRCGENAYAHGEEIVRKHKARLAEVLKILSTHQTIDDDYETN